MQFNYCMPTQIKFGRRMIMNDPESVVLGKRAFVMTGKNSGRRSGALGDTTEALKNAKVEYCVFEGVENNPTVEQCRELGLRARDFGADYIIGIGGGSPLDAAKAVAVFALNDIDTAALFKNAYGDVLPIVAIPTTSGTGSEVTPWSILTRHDTLTKQSFGSAKTFPKTAVLDPAYTDSLPLDVTRSTAMDAFTHSFESMITRKCSPYADALNCYALQEFSKCMDALENGDIGAIRDKLMLISLLGGAAIANTGTSMMHAMAYAITYSKGIPHGYANVNCLGAYVAQARKFRPDRLDAALRALGKTEDELVSYVKRNYPVTFEVTEEELRFWAEQLKDKHPSKTTGVPDDADYLYSVYKSMF